MVMQGETIINWNGGGTQHPLERLFELLETEPLHPTFEEYGNFAGTDVPGRQGEGFVLFWGNFYNYSHAFSVQSNDAAMIEKLTKLIRDNQATVAYKEARDQVKAYVAKRLAEHRAWMKKTA